MKISGLATGMDTESIIKDLMKASRIPLDKITQKKQYMEWILDDYRSINRNLNATSDKLFDTIMKQSTFMAKNVSISNPDAVSIKALNTTSEFSGTISVERLATQATIQGDVLFTPGNQLADTDFANSTLESLGMGTSIEITAPGKGLVTLNFASTATMKTVLERINKETGVSTFYDSYKGQIAMTAKNSGDGEITIDGTLGKSLKIDTSTVANGMASKGVNAVLTFNGLKTERPSNTFQINGFEVNLKQTTIATGPVTFTSAPNTDKVVDAVTQFVNDYNKMIEELNAKLREPKYRSFQPLSAEEKNDMKENEIKLWEEKAMSGTLRNDPEISNMLTKLRTIMSSSVTSSDGVKISLRDLGITASTSFTENGKLRIDETKLRTAIADNPNKVYEMFAKQDDTISKRGIAVQFRAVVDSSRKVISAKAGMVGDVNDKFTLGRTLKDMNKQIDRFEDRLKLMENRYWKQFSAMESAIQRLNAQSASLMSSFGG